MAALAEVEAVVGEEPPVEGAIGQGGCLDVGNQRMGHDGEVIAVELRLPGQVHLHPLPPEDGLLALPQLGAVQGVVDETVAADAMDQVALQRQKVGHAAKHLGYVGHHHQVDQQARNVVAQQPEGLPEIVLVLLEEVLRPVPVAHVRADVVVAHVDREELPVPFHVHLGVPAHQVDENAGLEGQVSGHDHRLGDVEPGEPMVDHQAVAHGEAVQVGIEDLEDVGQGEEAAPGGHAAAREGQGSELVDRVEGGIGQNPIARRQGVPEGSYDVYVPGPQLLYGSGRTAGPRVVQGAWEGLLLRHQVLQFSLLLPSAPQRLDIPQSPPERQLPGVDEQVPQIPIDVGVLRDSVPDPHRVVPLGVYSNIGQ